MNSKFVRRAASVFGALLIPVGIAAVLWPDVKESHHATSTAAPSATPTTLHESGGDVVLDQAVAGKYSEYGGQDALGAPIGQPKQAGSGTFQSFARGSIYSTPSTGAHVVTGEILNIYLANGGPSGALGFPKSDAFEVCGGPTVLHGGWGDEFENGWVWWLNKGEEKFKGYVTFDNLPDQQGSCPIAH